VFDYSQATATALRLLQQYGADTTLTKKSPSSVTAGGVVTKTETPSTVTACVLPYSGARDEKFSDALIQGKLRTVLIAADRAVPSVGDDIVVDGGPASIIGVTTLAPAGIAVFHNATVQKG
jgi:hypothetical protein